MLMFASGFFMPAVAVKAAPPVAPPAQTGDVTAFDLIIAMNTLRVSHGLPALVEDPIIDAVAQSTAEIMAANQMSWHIGDVSGRLSSAGYGGGAKVWATENFSVGSNSSIDQIMLTWADDSHMIPAVNPAYCHVGAGTAKSANGMTYYVLQAAYVSGKSCGEYKSPSSSGTGSTGNTGNAPSTLSQLIVAVEIATPDADGRIFHIVRAGQSFWSIAVAYRITIKDLEVWNNISQSAGLQIGQRLFIPSSNTAGYATPTPIGMVQLGTPDADGKIVHTVSAYQTLTSISQAYGVQIPALLTLNGISEDWPLQIGQKLIITTGSITPSPTPRPLTPAEKLTPASDGKYYHEVQSGQTLSWISELYNITINDLMAWNGLSGNSIIYPSQKLVLHVTPPATITPTPAPATITPTRVPPTATTTPTLIRTAASPTASVQSSAIGGANPVLWLGLVGILAAAGFVFAHFYPRLKRP
ncbi:MAG: LysM peptidoglycan-binding domain-containing protein [Anaerolineaceae bacterium]|nr:LysM peptidoglycan-binding domain-containing protein [Anaerolineaceae bacterium]